MSGKIAATAQTVLGLGLILMMATIVVQVLCNAFDINPLLQFERSLPFLGSALTLNSLLDAQWHLLVVIGLVPAGIIWVRDGHVRVDFLYQYWRVPVQARLNLLGNILFAAPFLWLALPASWNFMMRAWRSDEGSRNGGLMDLWLIKAALPFGLALLALAVVFETLRLLRQVR